MYSILQTSLLTLTYSNQTYPHLLRSQETQENPTEVVQAVMDVPKV